MKKNIGSWTAWTHLVSVFPTDFLGLLRRGGLLPFKHGSKWALNSDSGAHFLFIPESCWVGPRSRGLHGQVKFFHTQCRPFSYAARMVFRLFKVFLIKLQWWRHLLTVNIHVLLHSTYAEFDSTLYVIRKVLSFFFKRKLLWLLAFSVVRNKFCMKLYKLWNYNTALNVTFSQQHYQNCQETTFFRYLV